MNYCLVDSDSVSFKTWSLAQDCLNYTFRGNDTDEIKIFGVLHTIRAVPSGFVQRKLNMK